ncbi:MAG TPA: hypothetical protein VLA19_32070 [Herpetosiphonaceae bacterium]|nr:hypothetical protein [Herpetosiphonaceae bacterium]
MRLGFSVRVLGRPGLRAYDSRRAAHFPHLSVSLAHLRDIFAYLQSVGITMYRMAPDLAPYATHPDWPALHNQVDECRDELAELGEIARIAGLRLSFHAPSHVALASADPLVVEHSITLLHLLADLLDAMQQPREAVIVVHIGSMAGGVWQALDRWVRAWETLPARVSRRLVLEHDANALAMTDALRIHAATGVPLIFDYLHFMLNNPIGQSLTEGLGAALATWPVDVRPKVHFASPRTELRARHRRDEETGQRRWFLSPPLPGHHADFLNPWEFANFVRHGAGMRDFDVLLEAKAGDLALLRLREDLQHYIPATARLLTAGEHQG